MTAKEARELTAKSKDAAYTVEPGRNIYRDGKPFIAIHKAGDTCPTEADDMTHIIWSLLNQRHERLP